MGFFSREVPSPVRQADDPTVEVGYYNGVPHALYRCEFASEKFANPDSRSTAMQLGMRPGKVIKPAWEPPPTMEELEAAAERSWGRQSRMPEFIRHFLGG